MAGTAIVAAIIISALHLGRDIFVSVALAILLSFVLALPVQLLQRWHMPRAVRRYRRRAGVCQRFHIGGTLAGQIAQLAGDLPRYQATMRDKIQTLRGATAMTLNQRLFRHRPVSPFAGCSW